MIEKLKEILSMADVVASENITQVERISATVTRKNFLDAQITGLDVHQMVKNVFSTELIQNLARKLTIKCFDSAGELPDFNVNDLIDLNDTMGQNVHKIQRSFRDRIVFTMKEMGGDFKFIISNGNIVSVLQDVAGYTINPMNVRTTTSGCLYPMGKIDDISIYVDPYMRWNDNQILFGNNKVELRVDPNFDYQGFDELKEFKKIIDETPKVNLHPDIDPYGEENWDDEPTLEDSVKIGLLYKYNININDTNKFKKMKILDTNNLLI